MAAMHGRFSAFDLSKEDWTSYAECMSYYFVPMDVTNDGKKCSILLTQCVPTTFKLLKSLVDSLRLHSLSSKNL